MPELKFVPKGYSETDDFFAGVMVDAPEFSMNGMSVDQAFHKLNLGIDSVLAKAKRAEAIELLHQCQAELSAVRETFLADTSGDTDVRKAARKRLQRAYYDLYRKAGKILKPGAEIGPDDDV